MPIYDGTRVSAGTSCNFHLAWIAELRSSLNNVRLPTDYDALAEQFVGPFGPDVRTLQETRHEDWTSSIDDGSIAVKTSLPQTRLVVETDHEDYLPKRRTISIRHFSRTKVAYLELTAVGKQRIDTPLFLTAERYVLVPLQSTYDRAYQGLPKRWQRVLVGRQL